MINESLRVVLAVIVVFSSACSTADVGNPEIDSGLPPLDNEVVARGAELYQAHCASCHGNDLSGEDDWRVAKEDGSYPAPPHDSSGHTWHHPDDVLLEIIRDGSDAPQSRMPTFGEKLSDEEILAIIEFLKSSWGPEERAYQWQVTQRGGQPSG
mgnify:CR=1 FL=1